MAWTTDSTTRTEIAAAIAGSADQITQLNALANALGTGPRTMTVKWAPTGDPWNGSIVFQGTLTGANVVSAGKLQPGQVTAHGVATAVNMGPGSAVLRIANASGRYVQMPIGVAAGGVSLPRNPAGLFAMVLGDAFGIAADPSLAPAPDIQLSTVTLHNETAGVQAADFVAPMFGAPFKQGDIPVGSYPHFKTAGGVTCPATLHSITSWPDGSMKFCGVLLRVPATVPAGGTLAIQVRSGGSAPATGTRTTADLTNPDVRVAITGVDGLTGSWEASLNDAITTGGDLVKIADGPAGAVWRIGGEFRDTGSVAQGQIYCWHYVAALSNANGSLRGLRYLGRVGQPWASDAAGANVVGSRSRTVTMALRRGATVIRNLQGYSGPSSAALTLGGNILIPYFGSVFTAGENGQWDYIQGSGTEAVDCVVRASLDIPYLRLSKLIPPYDPSVTINAASAMDYYPGTSGSATRDMTGTGGAPGIGLLPVWACRHILRQDAGHERTNRINGLAAGGWRYSVRQKDTRQLVACVDIRSEYAGLGTLRTGWRYPTAAVGITVPSPNVGLWVEDVGHHPASLYWVYLFSGEPQYLDLQAELSASRILENPANNAVQINLTEPITSTSIVGSGGGSGTRGVQITGYPVRKGASPLFTTANGHREIAWRSRDLMHGASLLPDTDPAGTQLRQYFRDVLLAGYRAMDDYIDASTSTRAEEGFFTVGYNTTFSGNESAFMRVFLSWSACMHSDCTNFPEANRYREYMSRFWRSLQEDDDVLHGAAYRMNPWNGTTLVGNTAGYVFSATLGISMDQTTNTGTFAPASGSDPTTGLNWINIAPYKILEWTPQNGDVVSFGNAETSLTLPFSGVVQNQRLYLVNVTGLTVQFAATPGGSPLTVTSTTTIDSLYYRAHSPVEPSSYASYAASYYDFLRGALLYHKACGDPVDAAAARMVEVCAVQNFSVVDEPRARVLGTRA